MKPRPRIRLSPFASVPLMTLAYGLSGAVVGASAFPSALLVRWAAGALLSPPSAGRLLVFCLACGGALYLFFLAGLLLTGLLMRLLSLGVRPGAHRLLSLPGFWWMGMNGVQTIATRLLLRAVPGGWFSALYLRLAGCRIGRDAWIFGTILEPHLVRIGDGTVIGGETVISPHVASGADLFCDPIEIGRDCRIGAHVVICAGTTIGDGASVGIHAFLRRGSRVAPGAHVTALGALAPREAFSLERGSAGKRAPGRGAPGPGGPLP